VRRKEWRWRRANPKYTLDRITRFEAYDDFHAS